MAIYELRTAELNGVEGRGYAYPVKTFRGKEYKGVFFADEGSIVQEALGQEEVAFTGTVYERTRERVETLTVEVVDTVSSGLGERADFVVIETP